MTDTPGGPSLHKSPATDPARPRPPRLVLYAMVALILSGLGAVLASASLYTGSVKTWVRDGARDSQADKIVDKLDDYKKAGPTAGNRASELATLRTQVRDLKKVPSDQLSPRIAQLKPAVTALQTGANSKQRGLVGDMRTQFDDLDKLPKQVSAQQKGALISSLIVLVALAVAASAAYRGRYWTRWAVLGLWVLATFTGTLAGLGSVMSVAADIPALFKVPAFVAGLGLVVAVVLVNLRPSVAFFNLTRPARPAGQQRRGLFQPAPRPSGPRGGGGLFGGGARAATRQPTVPERETSAGTERARAKQRSNAEAVAKGADLARRRAKASKSRRTGV
ncbi:hypothetical protein SAMN05443575_1933 [Jatrophihabitans endophyticus]|uniref:Uncharacterized protein n=1 Tax=Jatrophihabitans endophyticus TaxID=1206085 RepID=A0A1M5ILC2_9ACTN|nr:hypothetical protein [Jatrophihabitans endophyticus]SHG29087.1 hypothetical protein SAMN05443575_1933 [Jatrophihabitans endophyticus]